MVDIKSVERQLKRIKFDASLWGRAEARELPNILLPSEEIFECVNGFYEGGFALLVSTNVRVLLIDKKPLNYLTVEDLRFDMINELDYSHRLFGAQITISAGGKTLKFKSYNQPRLRKLIGHVQHRMAEMKQEQSEHADTQKQHLEEINKQLQMYLLAQHQQIQLQNQSSQNSQNASQLPKEDPKLSDYLFAQRLLEQFHEQQSQSQTAHPDQPAQVQAASTTIPPAADDTSTEDKTDKKDDEKPRIDHDQNTDQLTNDLFAQARQEVFGKTAAATAAQTAPVTDTPGQSPSAASATPAPSTQTASLSGALLPKSLEVNPLKIAYSKLPMMLRNRKFGRPSFHAHSGQATPPQPAA